jgi:outer membrane protein W
MKKLLLAVAGIILVFAFAAMAQDAAPAGGKISWGLKAGVGMANATGDSAEADPGWEKKARMGFGGGAQIDYALSPAISARLEVLYLMKGVKYDSGSVKSAFKADYLEFPLTLHVAPQMNGKFQPNFFAGPYLAMLLSGKLKIEGTGDVDIDGERDIKDSLMKSTDFGLTFGAGFDYKMTKSALTFDVRYDLGFSKVLKLVDDGTNTEAPNTKTSGIFFMIGYKFGY